MHRALRSLLNLLTEEVDSTVECFPKYKTRFLLSADSQLHGRAVDGTEPKRESSSLRLGRALISKDFAPLGDKYCSAPLQVRKLRNNCKFLCVRTSFYPL